VTPSLFGFYFLLDEDGDLRKLWRKTRKTEGAQSPVSVKTLGSEEKKNSFGSKKETFSNGSQGGTEEKRGGGAKGKAVFGGPKRTKKQNGMKEKAKGGRGYLPSRRESTCGEKALR